MVETYTGIVLYQVGAGIWKMYNYPRKMIHIFITNLFRKGNTPSLFRYKCVDATARTVQLPQQYSAIPDIEY